MKGAILAAAPRGAFPAAAGSGLKPVLSSDLVINRIATSYDGRMFLPVQTASLGAGAPTPSAS